MTQEKVIKNLVENLKDEETRDGWVANIAMAHVDSERWYREKNNKVGKYLNYSDKHTIANNAAKYFLQLLEA